MNSAKIMIVEDNTTVAEDCSDCLKSLGYIVTSIVPSGEESIKRAETEKPDAVIMDIHLRDEIDGIEAARQIYNRFETPVVFLSAYSDRNLLKRAKQVGSFGYLIKPFEERELYAALEMALYKSKVEKERRQMETRLRHTQKMEGLELMAGSIAHNYNNLMMSVIGNIELALTEKNIPSSIVVLIDDANQSAKRAADISTQMLMYVGQGQGELIKVNLSKLIQNTSLLLQTTTHKNISFSINLAHEDATIMANSAQLHQLIINLLTNAVEAIGDEQGSITITTRIKKFECDELKETYLHEDLPAGDYVILEFADTGCGIDQETLEKIFDPFFTTNFVGRGLGLAAVLGIVRSHNGAITIESKPEQGATFKVMFPVSDQFEAPVDI